MDELALPLLAPITASPQPKRRSNKQKQQQEQQQLQAQGSNDAGVTSLIGWSDSEQQRQSQQAMSSHDDLTQLPAAPFDPDHPQQQQQTPQPKLTAFKGLNHLREGQREQQQRPARDTLMRVLNTPLQLASVSAHSLSTGSEAGSSSIPPLSLSSGQQQLLCLSRMLLSRQKRPHAVVLLDEITSNVDKRTAATIQQVR